MFQTAVCLEVWWPSICSQKCAVHFNDCSIFNDHLWCLVGSHSAQAAWTLSFVHLLGRKLFCSQLVKGKEWLGKSQSDREKNLRQETRGQLDWWLAGGTQQGEQSQEVWEENNKKATQFIPHIIQKHLRGTKTDSVCCVQVLTVWGSSSPLSCPACSLSHTLSHSPLRLMSANQASHGRQRYGEGGLYD